MPPGANVSEKAVLLALIAVYPRMCTTRQIRELLGGTGNAVSGRLRTLGAKGLVESEALGKVEYWATWPAVMASELLCDRSAAATSEPER